MRQLLKTVSITEYGAESNGEICTEYIQKAIDDCFLNGGGTVVVPSGRYLTGSVRLRSNVTLYLKKNACLEGSRSPEDYKKFINDSIEPIKEEYKTTDVWKSVAERKSYDFMNCPAGRWSNAIIRAIDAENIAIIGEENSEIDGMDCFDELGEENYRGPHAISMHYCRNIRFSGYTVRNSANWAHALFGCKNIEMDNVDVIAGHDGVHITTCDNTEIKNCRFYTGDDCVAGIDNINVTVENCDLNTACSAFRFGGTNVLITDCRIYGPARYLFRGSLSDEEKRSGRVSRENTNHRFNMLSVFTYYADFSREIREIPGNIIVKNSAVENADRFLHYNFSGNEPWQANKPMRDITFENIKASGIKMPLTVYGDRNTRALLSIKNCDIAFGKGTVGVPFMQAANYENIKLENIKISNISSAPLIKKWTDGEISLNNVESGGCNYIETASDEFFAQSI